MSQANANTIRTALSLARTFPTAADARMEGEMHKLLAEYPGLAARPMKLLCAAQIRVGQRDARSWPVVMAGVVP